MGRARFARGQRHSRLSSGLRRPGGRRTRPASGVRRRAVLHSPPSPEFPFGPARGVAAGVFAAGLALAGGAAAAQEDGARLLTGLTAEAGPDGVVLDWAVDEGRAHRIAGFTCVYRTPGHLKTGVSGAVPCEPVRSRAEARSRTVAGLPEYGAYDFELVALERAGGPAIPWLLRALRVRVALTEDLAGPAGPGRAVTGAGPLVEGCGPDDGGDDRRGEAPPARPWRLDEIVSARHLTHYPARGWTPGGDPAAPPAWPDMPPMTDLMAETGLDPAPVRRALGGDRAAAGELARTLADARFDAVLARAAAGTKALLRPGRDGGHELRLHTSYPFGADYLFEARHAVPGWGDADHAAAWPGLWNRTDCPPLHLPDGTHDVALALSDAAGGGRRLAHAGYGWWTVAPAGMYPERIVAAKSGISFGAPADRPPKVGARWRGRGSGHLFRNKRRFVLAGDLALTLVRSGGRTRLAGRIDNVVLVPLDRESLRPLAGPAIPWRALALEAGAAVTPDGARPARFWSGTVRPGAPPRGGLEEMPAGLPASGAFRGDWRAAFHGPGGSEVAGRLRLWTPLPDGADPRTAWPGQAVLAAGFGGVRAR